MSNTIGAPGIAKAFRRYLKQPINIGQGITWNVIHSRASNSVFIYNNCGGGVVIGFTSHPSKLLMRYEYLQFLAEYRKQLFKFVILTIDEIMARSTGRNPVELLNFYETSKLNHQLVTDTNPDLTEEEARRIVMFTHAVDPKTRCQSCGSFLLYKARTYELHQHTCLGCNITLEKRIGDSIEYFS